VGPSLKFVHRYMITAPILIWPNTNPKYSRNTSISIVYFSNCQTSCVSLT